MPLAVGVVSIFVVSLILFFISRSLYLSQVENDGKQYAELILNVVKSEIDELEQDHAHQELMMQLAAERTLSQQGDLTNNKLSQIASLYEVDIIYYFSPQGQVLSSSTSEYIGWTIQEGDPIDAFVKSDLDDYTEPIRKSVTRDNFLRAVYLRSKSGHFIQVIEFVDNIYSQSKNDIYQNTVEAVVKAYPSITHVAIYSGSYQALADSDNDFIGLSDTQIMAYQDVYQGETQVMMVEDHSNQQKLLEVSLPIDGQVSQGILRVSMDINQVSSDLFYHMLSTGLITLVMIAFFYYHQNQNMTKPINVLDEHVANIDLIKNPTYLLPVSENKPFEDVYTTFNTLLRETTQAFRQIDDMHQEIQHRANHDF